MGRLPGQTRLTIDSYYMTLVIESGFIGLGLFLVALLAIAIKAAIAAIEASGVSSWIQIALATGMLASLAVKTVLSLTNNLELLYLFAGMSVVAGALARELPARPLEA